LITEKTLSQQIQIVTTRIATRTTIRRN